MTTPYRPLHGYRDPSTFALERLRGFEALSSPPAEEDPGHLSFKVARTLSDGFPVFQPALQEPVQPVDRLQTSRGRMVRLEERTPISDQGRAGSCTAHGRCDALELTMAPGKVVQLSRADCYWRSRWEHGDQDEDSGSWSHVSRAVVTEVGVARESLWPYSDKISHITRRPPLVALLDAARHRVPKGVIQRIKGAGKGRVAQVKVALDLGCPVTVDARVGEDFCGNPPLDKAMFAPTHIVGGHCFILTGYWEKSDGNVWFLARNSWGTDWCDQGYGWIDQSYVADPSAVEDLDVTTAAFAFGPSDAG
jgi:hypothetical protein